MIHHMGHQVVISLGSNLTQGEDMITQCVKRLGELISFESSLWIYTTPAVSGKGPDYYNCVMAGLTTEDFDGLTAKTKSIEIAMGRTPECKGLGVVPIDIDIVVFDGEVKRPRDFAQQYFTIGYNRLVDTGLSSSMEQ